MSARHADGLAILLLFDPHLACSALAAAAPPLEIRNKQGCALSTPLLSILVPDRPAPTLPHREMTYMQQCCM